VGDLHYGLARIAAEKSDLSASLALYQQAFAADPGVGAFQTPGTRSISTYFEYMNPEMLARFEQFNNRVAAFASSIDAPQHKTLDAVRSFVLNDYGNACLVFFHRFGDERYMARAIDAYHASIEQNPENPVVYHNLDNAYFWRRTFTKGTHVSDKYEDCLARVQRLAPQWVAMRMKIAEQNLDKSFEQLQRQRKILSANSEELSRLKIDLEELSKFIPHNLERRSANQQESDELKNRIASLSKKTEDAANALADSEAGFLRELDEGIAGILGPTKLSSFAQSAEGVRSMVAASVVADRFNEEDIAAMKHWMLVLVYGSIAHGQPRKDNLEACRLLADYIFRYYPEDLDTSLRLRDVHYHLGRVEPEAGAFAMSPYDAHSDNVIRSVISRWRQLDPIHNVIVEYWYGMHLWSSSLLRAQKEGPLPQTIREMEDGLPSLDQNRDTYYFRLGKLYQATGDLENARSRFDAVIRIKPDDALCCEYLGDVYVALGNAREAMLRYREAARLNPAGNAAQKLADLSQSIRRTQQTMRFGEKVFGFLPISTPIVIEIGSDLIPYVAGPNEEGLLDSLQTLIKRMRRDIQSRLGVKVPGIRFRGLTDEHPRDSYAIYIMEAPVASGTISAVRRFLPGAFARGVSDAEPAVVPWNGEAGFWISQKDWPRFQSDLWQIMEYPLRHLEALVIDRLGEFLGHQEVYNLVETAASERCEHLDHHPAELTALTAVLRAMIKEQAPVTPLKPVLEMFLNARERGLSLSAIVEKARSLPEIRPQLHGNSEEYTLYRLSGELEAGLGRFVQQGRLAFPAERLRALLAAVRAKAETRTRIAVVVENAILRPLVKSATMAEFPRMPVLALRELRPEFAGKMAGNIELPRPV
jgi:tetratricopeptide (TPR) repeat protein